ncbi:hypothetical protein AB4622_20115 [Vibrio splendidus]
MEMKDYLNGTSDTVNHLHNRIKFEISKFSDIDSNLAAFDAAESYIRHGHVAGKETYEREFSSYTADEIAYWKQSLIDSFTGSQVAIDTMSASILMIAQNGIKLVFGSPRTWDAHKGVELSSKGECLFQTIWHGRNLAAHVEGLNTSGLSYQHFQDVELRKNIDLLSNSANYQSRYIVRELLGWIESEYDPRVHEINGQSAFHQDMLRIGTLA